MCTAKDIARRLTAFGETRPVALLLGALLTKEAMSASELRAERYMFQSEISVGSRALQERGWVLIQKPTPQKRKRIPRDPATPRIPSPRAPIIYKLAVPRTAIIEHYENLARSSAAQLRTLVAEATA